MLIGLVLDSCLGPSIHLDALMLLCTVTGMNGSESSR